MKTKQHSLRTTIRHTALGVIFASSIVATVPAQAGWFSHAASKVQHKVQHAAANVHHTAAATVGNIEDTVRDISVKVNTMYQSTQRGLPLLGNIHDAKLMENLFDMLKFMTDAREDYDDFAVNGSTQFRSDLLKIFSDLEQINETVLHRHALKEKLEKATTLVNKLPKTLLYPMYQAFGAQLQGMDDKLAMLQQNLAPYAKMPTMKDVLSNPQSYQNDFCNFQEDHKIRRAVIKVVLGQLSVIVGVIKDVVPRDLDVDAEVVGEGAGGTITAHPAYIIASVMDVIITWVKEDVDDYETIGGALCPGPK